MHNHCGHSQPASPQMTQLDKPSQHLLPSPNTAIPLVAGVGDGRGVAWRGVRAARE